jgi:hypothetical protein
MKRYPIDSTIYSFILILFCGLLASCGSGDAGPPPPPEKAAAAETAPVVNPANTANSGATESTNIPKGSHGETEDEPDSAEALTTEGPTTEAPTTKAPIAEAPIAEAPTAEAPTAETVQAFDSASEDLAPSDAETAASAFRTETDPAYVESLMVVQSGDLPIILTAPHGGQKRIDGVPRRKKTGGAVTVWDTGSLEVALELAKQIEAAFGKKPYVVAAKFSRKYLDAGRDSSRAYQSPAAKPVYDAYHKHVLTFVKEVQEKYPEGGILLDIHAQGTDPNTIYRGTKNGQTTSALLSAHKQLALTGKNSILGVMKNKYKYKIDPDNKPLFDPPENTSYSGGYTVVAYGSHNQDGVGNEKGTGIDAIQLELGSNQRLKGKRVAFSKDLTAAIQQFYGCYLVEKDKAVCEYDEGEE